MTEQRTVLLVEDSPEDAFFIRRALQRSAFHGLVHHVQDGQQAIDYLSGQNGFRDRSKYPLPHVVLTDIKMPRVGGFELVQWIREHEEFQQLPVAMLTSSQLEKDRELARSLGVCAFLVKDILLRDQTELVETIQNCAPPEPAAAPPVGT